MGDLKVTIIGGGSVGLCLAASFVQAGAKVALTVRAGSVDKLREEPITVAGMFGDHRVEAGKIAVEDNDKPSVTCRDCDVLFVTTKAYDVARSLRPFATMGTDSPRAIVLLQNGLGSAEAARATIGLRVPVFSTAMYIGMQRHGLAHVSVNAYSSPIRIGALLGDNSQTISEMLNVATRGFVPMVHDPEIRNTIFTKLLFNSCMNPTGALIGRNYGELLENVHSRELIANLAEETLRVFAASNGFRPAESGQHYVDKILTPLVIPRSAPHRSSMFQDLESGRLTEIDYLNGAIVKMGRKLGIDTPYHQAIVALIHAREVAA